MAAADCNIFLVVSSCSKNALCSGFAIDKDELALFALEAFNVAMAAADFKIFFVVSSWFP